MKRIVVLTDQISKIGGINSLIHLKANYWAEKKGHTVHIVTTEQGNSDSFYSISKLVSLHDLGIKYDRHSSYFKPRNFLQVVKNYYRLNTLLKQIKPEVVIVANHIPVTYFFPLLWSKAKFVKEFHFSQFYHWQKKKSLFNKFEYYIESKFDHLVVLNSEEREFYNSNKVVHIPNPIKLVQGFEPQYENRENTAIAAGRISPVKRFDVLVDIWHKFTAINKVWNLEIYGGGEEDDVKELQQKIVKLRLQDRITLKESTNKLHEVMQTAGIYLMTSAQECFPMVLLEAQANGLPIIAFDCPTGPRNIITQGNDGILVPFDDESAFVTELDELTTKDEKRIQLAKNGYISSKQYELGQIMDLWETKIIQSP